MKIKQVIIARKDLNMRAGKMSAQSCHASMQVFLNQNTSKDPAHLSISLNDDWQKWLLDGFAKIVVGCNSEAELIEIYNQAVVAELPAAIITDEGRTEFHGVYTKTAVAIGPARADLIDKITGGLKLL